MLDLLHMRFASNRMATCIFVLQSLYSKQFSSSDDLSTYIDELQSLFMMLEHMSEDTKILETHRALLLKASMGNMSPLESSIVALRTRDKDQLPCEYVTSDLIQEWSQIRLFTGGKDNECQNSGDSDF